MAMPLHYLPLLIAFLLPNSHFILCTVTYDRKAILINAQRRILFSGSIHYPRSTPQVIHSFLLLSLYKLINYFSHFTSVFDSQMWEDLIHKAKNGGLDVVETYVFWNVHEPYPGIVNSLITSFFIHFHFSFHCF